MVKANSVQTINQENGVNRPQRATGAGSNMAATGELIRLINYVDDINTTLRRISASIPMMDAEERKRLAENIRTASTNLNAVLGQLDKGQ
jgi:hypothetical protein